MEKKQEDSIQSTEAEGGNRRVVVGVVVAVVVLGVLYVVFSRPSGEKMISTNAPASNNIPSQTGQKFVDQDYAKSAYLISGDMLSTEARQALAGFDLQKESSSDGTVMYTLKALKPEYHDQVYILKPGEQLYFIEKFLGDDVNEDETNIRDDTAAVVDAQGMIVEAPRDFSQ